MSGQWRRWADVMLGLCLAAPTTLHADPQDIEEGEPVTLEDAFTDPPGQLSLQFSGAAVHEHQDGKRDLLEQGPTFKLGALRGVQVSLNPNYDTGTASGRNAGFVLGDVLVQLNEQTRLLPAFAVDVFASVPFGAGRKSAGTIVRAIASRYLGGEGAPRLHLNLTDFHLVRPDTGDRRDQIQLAVGGSFAAGERNAIVADVVQGAAEQAGRTETFVELGYSRDLPDDWTFQLGVGRQVAGTGNAIRVFFAIEKELQVF